MNWATRLQIYEYNVVNEPQRFPYRRLFYKLIFANSIFIRVLRSEGEGIYFGIRMLENLFTKKKSKAQ